MRKQERSELINMEERKDMKIAVAGAGYVGLSIATLLAQHNRVTVVDVIPEKVDMINQRKSPIQRARRAVTISSVPIITLKACRPS